MGRNHFALARRLKLRLPFVLRAWVCRVWGDPGIRGVASRPSIRVTDAMQAPPHTGIPLTVALPPQLLDHICDLLHTTDEDRNALRVLKLADSATRKAVRTWQAERDTVLFWADTEGGWEPYRQQPPQWPALPFRAAVEALSKYPRVTGLTFGGADVRGENAVCVARYLTSTTALTALKSLRFQDLTMDVVGASAIGGCLPAMAALEELQLTADETVSGLSILLLTAHLVARAPSLRSLTIGGVRSAHYSVTRSLGPASMSFDGTGPEELSVGATLSHRLSSLTRLTELAFIKSSHSSSGLFEDLSKCFDSGGLTALRSLDLRDNGLLARAVVAMSPRLAGLCSLTSLNLDHVTSFPDSRVLAALVNGISGLISLRELSLRRCHLSDGGVCNLAGHLSKLSRLTALMLADNDIGRKGILRLAGALPSLAACRSLELGDNPLHGKVPSSTGTGVMSQLLEGLAGMTALTELDLTGVGMPPNGAKLLAAGLHRLGLSHEIRLDLRENPLLTADVMADVRQHLGGSTSGAV